MPDSYTEKYSYYDGTGGDFFNIGNSIWEEWKEGNIFVAFIETDRDNKWITLYDDSRSMYLRLSINGGTAYWKNKGDSSWNTWIYVEKTYPEAPTIIQTPVPTEAPTIIQTVTTTDPDIHVLLYGEKTNVTINENILLRLSAVNLINKPIMSVQVILYPPSGMSITGQEFVKSGAGIYTTTYKLEPGESKDIEIKIMPNQIGDFNVKGTIVYYFGDDKDSTESKTQILYIKVKDNIKTFPKTTDIQMPGFRVDIILIILIVLLFSYMRRK